MKTNCFRKIITILLLVCLCLAGTGAAYAAEEPVDTEPLCEETQTACDLSLAEDSPVYVDMLAETEQGETAEEVQQLFIVAATGTSTADVSMHQKDENGDWKQILSTSGLIGKYGLGKTREGDMKTPVGTYHFNAAFGIREDPGCTSFAYHQVTRDDYWFGDLSALQKSLWILHLRLCGDSGRDDGQGSAECAVGLPGDH